MKFYFELDLNKMYNFFKIFNLKGTLEAKENLCDSKREVDNQLKKSCEVFIQNVSEDLFGSISQLVKQVIFRTAKNS